LKAHWPPNKPLILQVLFAGKPSNDCGEEYRGVQVQVPWAEKKKTQQIDMSENGVHGILILMRF
jgi:hypothetical protein